jgi:hypothetical protein
MPNELNSLRSDIGRAFSGRGIPMPRPKTWKDRVFQWMFMPIAAVLALIRLDKLAVAAFLLGCAALLHYAEGDVRWDIERPTSIPK